MKRILVIGTGGTIVSKKNTRGLRPELGIAELIRMSSIPKDICTLEGITSMNIDSTNMTPDRKDWIVLAGDFNTETLVAKTMIAMGTFKTIEEIKQYIETPYTIPPL